MHFSLTCRHKGADYRSSVYQRAVGNFKHSVFISFLMWSNIMASLYKDLKMRIFFCQLSDVRLQDLNKKTDYTESPVKCKSSQFITSNFFCDILWFFTHSLRFLVWDCKMFSAAVPICSFIRFSCWPCICKCLLWGSH